MAELAEIEEIGQKVDEWFETLTPLQIQALLEESEKYLSHDFGNISEFFYQGLENFKTFSHYTSQQNVGARTRNKTAEKKEKQQGKGTRKTKNSNANTNPKRSQKKSNSSTVKRVVRETYTPIKSELDSLARYYYNSPNELQLPYFFLQCFFLGYTPVPVVLTPIFAGYMYYYGRKRSIEEIENLKKTIKNQIDLYLLDKENFSRAKENGSFEEPHVIKKRIDGLKQRLIITESQKTGFLKKINGKGYYTQIAYDLNKKISEENTADEQLSLKEEIIENLAKGNIAEWDKDLLLKALQEIK